MLAPSNANRFVVRLATEQCHIAPEGIVDAQVPPHAVQALRAACAEQ